MGIEGVNNRIADIQSRILALQTQQATKTTSASPATGTTSASGASFASALADAMGTQTAGASNKSYTLNSKGIPTELAAYGNGKIPANALGRVGNTNHKLWAPAAESLNQMIADAKAQGVTIGITDSYRSYEEQVDVARRKGLYSQGGLAAKPGTSEHGWGMATDLDLNSKAQAWMRANGEKYGFVENVPREPWHWAYKPKTA
ncbi:M15 family metallopeptidase [Couchioplanes caeruleus]|uniref:Peptidase M15 n=2 Tax=Couchioplanes caeruleus TaxID=56438 RepID=A0A1K0FBL7_9ACTN|nr:M15 family metallopeptidase [Couchioplanes caeruleus]OJF10233.1 peptidase M15 [Couchioplanes caeruleus subsp. caeruleus]ROP29371.1 D-alanyl-D-alanine carboxypeptidase-like protein [Couchioplanes caeruleus]